MTLIAIRIDHENHRPATRRRIPPGIQRCLNAPGYNRVADLKSAPLQAFQQALRRGEFQQGSALGVFAQQSNGQAFPAFRLAPLRLAPQLPLILKPVYVDDTGQPVNIGHAGTSSRSTTAHHPAVAERNKRLGIGANLIDNRQFLSACVTTWFAPGVMGEGMLTDGGFSHSQSGIGRERQLCAA